MTAVPVRLSPWEPDTVPRSSTSKKGLPMSNTTVPNKVRVTLGADRAHDPLAQCADALTTVFPRIRLVLGHIETLPEAKQKQLARYFACLNEFVQYIRAPDFWFLKCIETLIDTLTEETAWEKECFAETVIVEVLADVHRIIQGALDRRHAEAIMRDLLTTVDD